MFSIPIIDNFTEAYKIVKPKLKDLTIDLAKRGWFFNSSTNYSVWVSVLLYINRKEYEVAEKILLENFESEMPSIFKRLRSIYSEIEKNLLEAEQCIQNEMYFAAIPLLLTISEYIANTVTSKTLNREEHHLLSNKKRNRTKYESEHKLENYFGQEIALNDRFS